MSTRFYFKQFSLAQAYTSVLFNPRRSGPGSYGNKGVLRIPQSSSITEASPSDCLVPYVEYSLVGKSYPSAEMQLVNSTAPADLTTSWGSFIPLQRCSRIILKLQPTGPVSGGETRMSFKVSIERTIVG